MNGKELLRERKKKQMAKSTDTGLHTLMNFMRENNAVFFYTEKLGGGFALVTEHGLTDQDLVPKDSIHCSFVTPDAGDDIENEYLKPAIAAMNRCRDET